jgi:DNA-binding NarL/FixJ family response regulator
VVGDTDNGRDVINLILDRIPDVAIVDYSLPLINGVEATRIVEVLIFLAGCPHGVSSSDRQLTVLMTGDCSVSVILVIDENSVYRNGLRDVIEERVAKCRVIDTSTLEHLAGNDGFDLVLIDADSIERSSVDRLRQLRAFSPKTSFALMSTSHTRSDVLDCLSAGFHGFIYKLDLDEELLVAINDLLSGRMYVPRWLVDETASPEASAAHHDLPKLTRRQNEILPLLAQGMSNKEIAKLLNISPGTTKIHTAALLRALRARNRTEAAFVAAKIVRSRSP